MGLHLSYDQKHNSKLMIVLKIKEVVWWELSAGAAGQVT